MKKIKTIYHREYAPPPFKQVERLVVIVKRFETIKIRYKDENFNTFEQEFSGLAARVIQHEYDHIEGILFTDKINPLKKQMIKRKLTDITKGNVKTGYRMRFPKLNNR